jgi:hypothetical protein
MDVWDCLRHALMAIEGDNGRGFAKEETVRPLPDGIFPCVHL